MTVAIGSQLGAEQIALTRALYFWKGILLQ
jgi:hypothetical protein